MFPDMQAAEVAARKCDLLSAVAATGRGEGEPAGVFAAAAALEEAATAAGVRVQGELVGGSWSLVFSEQEAQGAQGLGDESVVDRLTAQAYRFFFRFAPALAGAQKGQARSWWGTPRNEQRVDLERGTVENVVEVAPPAGSPLPRWRLRVTVGGEAAAVDGRDASELRIMFTSFQASLSGEVPPWLPSLPPVPLPRPVGQLRTVFVDDDLRVSRGGRGGLFVLRRRGPRRRGA